MATVAAVYNVKPRHRTQEDVVESLFRDPAKPRTAPTREDSRDARPDHKRIWASLDDGKDEVIRQAGADAEQRNPDRAKKMAAITDGERGSTTNTWQRAFPLPVAWSRVHARRW